MKLLVGGYSLVSEKTELPMFKLTNALKNRTIIYSGGGSTYDELRLPVNNFSDIVHINPKVWEGMTIDERFCVNLGDRHILAWLTNLSDNQHIN